MPKQKEDAQARAFGERLKVFGDVLEDSSVRSVPGGLRRSARRPRHRADRTVPPPHTVYSIDCRADRNKARDGRKMPRPNNPRFPIASIIASVTIGGT